MSLIYFVNKINEIKKKFKREHIKREITYLPSVKDKKLKNLIIGSKIKYFNSDMCKLNINEIKKINLVQYDIIIINSNYNYSNNDKIIKIINYLIENKKKIIIESYTSNLNMNIDNFNNWFRPLDIKKEPFNFKIDKILYSNISKYFLTQYILFLGLITYINLKKNNYSNIFLYFITLLLLFIVPFKQIYYINN
jgi:hypothetical protein